MKAEITLPVSTQFTEFFQPNDGVPMKWLTFFLSTLLVYGQFSPTSPFAPPPRKESGGGGISAGYESDGLTNTTAQVSVTTPVISVGANRLMLIPIEALPISNVEITRVTVSNTLSGVTNDAVLKHRTNYFNALDCSLFYLTAPSFGTNVVHVVLNGVPDSVNIRAAVFTNVNQSTPLGTSVAGASGGDTWPGITNTVSCAVNDLIFDAAIAHGAGGRTYAPGTGQTERGSDPATGVKVLISTKLATATSHEMSWIVTGGNIWFSQFIVPIKPAP